MDRRPGGDRRPGEAETIVQGVKVARALLAHGTMIDSGTELLFEFRLADEARAGDAEAVEFRLPGFELILVAGLGDGVEVAPAEIAVDPMARDPVGEQRLRFLRHGEGFGGISLAELGLDLGLA